MIFSRPKSRSHGSRKNSKEKKSPKPGLYQRNLSEEFQKREADARPQPFLKMSSSFGGDLSQCPVSSSLKNSSLLNSSHGGREKASQERSRRDFGGEQIPLVNPPIPEAWGWGWGLNQVFCLGCNSFIVPSPVIYY